MKMKWKLNIPKEVRVAAALVGVGALIGFSEKEQARIVCHNVIVEMSNDHENYFMDEAEAMRLVAAMQPGMIGTDMADLNLKEIENKLMTDSHIDDAQLYSDLKGNIVVSVRLKRPIARLVRSQGPDAYIAEDGTIMSTSDKYTSRVLLVSGGLCEKLATQAYVQDVEQGANLLEMIRYIHDDEFWRAQVAQLDVNASGEVRLLPQVTGQIVEFGKAEQVESKFSKLMIFYKEILPQRGWTRYKRVNLEFEGQIIAE
jgi:cell division protein FtsQ